MESHTLLLTQPNVNKALLIPLSIPDDTSNAAGGGGAFLCAQERRAEFGDGHIVSKYKVSKYNLIASTARLPEDNPNSVKPTRCGL